MYTVPNINYYNNHDCCVVPQPQPIFKEQFCTYYMEDLVPACQVPMLIRLQPLGVVLKIEFRRLCMELSNYWNQRPKWHCNCNCNPVKPKPSRSLFGQTNWLKRFKLKFEGKCKTHDSCFPGPVYSVACTELSTYLWGTQLRKRVHSVLRASQDCSVV